MRLSKHQQWLDNFLYPFEMLQQYCFKMYFMIRVTELVVKLLDSGNFYWFSNCLLSNVSFSDVMKKNENLNKSALSNVLVTASWDLCYSTRLLCGEGTVGCHFGRVFENRFSPAAAIILQRISCLSEMQHQSTCCLCLTHLFCISFCFVSSFTTEQQKRLSSLAGMMWKVCYSPAAASAGAKLLLW